MQIETHGGAGHARRPRRSKVYVKTIGDKTSMKIMMIPGFSWAKSVGPKLPKLADGSCPQWCPATHFGYQTQGTCKIKFEDGTETTINARRGVLEAASTSARRRMGRTRAL